MSHVLMTSSVDRLFGHMTLSCDLSCDQDYVILMSKFGENLGGWGDFITILTLRKKSTTAFSFKARVSTWQKKHWFWRNNKSWPN